ncbi:MAG: zf-HC2 domain-containing protein [Planctomycetota bacterium]|nr:zf-HC2 domain-containing protein [Planctomycetota bacterium]
MNLPFEPTLLPCQEIEPMLGSHLDRELTRAEEVRVEAHLDDCDRCRARLEHLEALSGALKGWEAGAITPVPPDLRLKNAVLARVAETSHQRRVDDRVLRLTHFAVAACVLVALGLGFVLGLGFETPVDATPGAQGGPIDLQTHVGSLPDTALRSRDRYDEMALKARTSLDEIDVPFASAPLPELPKLTAIDAGVLSHALAQRDVLDLERATGDEGVVLPGRFEDTIVVTRDVLDSPSLRQSLQKWLPDLVEPASVAPEAAPTRTTPTAVLGEPTGMTVKDLLGPMQGLYGDVNSFRSAPPALAWEPAAGAEAARRVGTVLARGIHRSRGAARPALSSTDGTAARKAVTVVDPLAAQEDGQLAFEDQELEKSVVIVRVANTQGPIFIPAGQVLSGGVTDRVTAQPLWIPRSPNGTMRFRLACMPIRRGPDRTEAPERVQLTRWIVGPSLRSLLAQGVSEQAFLDVAERHFQASGQPRARFDAFSLLDVLKNPHSEVLDARAEYKQHFDKDPYAGFVFTRGGGEVLGVEVVRFTGDAAGKLLARLWVGYQLEAWLRTGISAGDRRALPRDARRLEGVLHRLRRSTNVFHGKRDEQLVRVSRADIEHSRLHFQAVELGERQADGALEFVPLHVSGTVKFTLR